MDTRTLEHGAARIALQDLPLEDTCNALDGLLRRAIDYDVAAWSTQDPATGLFTSCTVSGLPKDLEREARFFLHEFDADEPATFRELIATGTDVAILSEVTGGRLEAAGRYRDWLAAYGCTDEIRVVLRADGPAWGSVVAYRRDGVFGPDDRASASALAPHAARALRLVLLRAAATRPEAVADPPGILTVHGSGRVEPATEPARVWLERVGAPLATAANAVAAAVRGNLDWAGAHSRLPGPDGRLLSLHAARMLGDDGEVAVIVDVARPAQVSALLVEGYGLTARQREVLGGLLLGRSPTELARELGISAHTVNDHRKAIYERLGVRSRAELAALLQVEHYEPLTRAGAHPSPYGGFLDADRSH